MPYTRPGGQQTFPTDKAAALRGIRIVTFALAQGVVFFGVIALWANKGAINGKPDVLSVMGLVIAGVMIVAQLFIPAAVAKAALADMTAEELRELNEEGVFVKIGSAFRTKHIVGCAMLEGAAFLNLVAYMTEECLYPLLTAVVLLALILAKWPTAAGLDFWVQDRAREIELR